MNDNEYIIDILQNAGIKVHGISNGFIRIEDPACLIRGFENFFKDAWIVLVIITGVMVFMWGISLIRGAKRDIKNNFKVLVLILGIMSAAIPILNVMYGGDLLGMGCKEVQVPIEEVNSLLVARQANGTKDFSYEDIDIYDSGPVSDINTGEPVPPDVDHLFEYVPDEPQAAQNDIVESAE